MIERLAEDAILTLADSLPDMVFLVDTTGKIRHVNAKCKDTLGFAQSDIIGQTMIELVVPRDCDKTLAEASVVMAGNRRSGFENRYQHRDGSDIHLSWSAHWLGRHQLRLGVARDVTALRQPACNHLIPATLLDLLDPVEQEVLLLLLTAASENQIAARVGLSAPTMHACIASIFRKLGVRGRFGLMSLCLSSLETE
jgi:PAS domain S-box-containing protein